MSIFLTAAVVCTMATCNDYHIDKATTLEDGVTNTQRHEREFLKIWEDEQKLNQWLAKYQIGETVFEIVSIDFETQELEENEIP